MIDPFRVNGFHHRDKPSPCNAWHAVNHPTVVGNLSGLAMWFRLHPEELARKSAPLHTYWRAHTHQTHTHINA